MVSSSTKKKKKALNQIKKSQRNEIDENSAAKIKTGMDAIPYKKEQDTMKVHISDSNESSKLTNEKNEGSKQDGRIETIVLDSNEPENKGVKSKKKRKKMKKHKKSKKDVNDCKIAIVDDDRNEHFEQNEKQESVVNDSDLRNLEMMEKDKDKKNKSDDHDAQSKTTEPLYSSKLPPRSDSEALEQLVTLLQSPNEILLQPILPQTHTQTKNPKSHIEDATNDINATTVDIEGKLTQITQYLFARLEKLAHQHDTFQYKLLKQKPKYNENHLDTCPLSGIHELFMLGQQTHQHQEELSSISPTSNLSKNGKNKSQSLDMDTIWGQIEIQNQALINKVNTSVKQMKKRLKKFNQNNSEDRKTPKLELPCLLDLNDNFSNDENDNVGDTEDEVGSEATSINDDKEDIEDNENNEEEDEETRRIRERMERTIAEMENDEMNNKGKDDETEINIVNQNTNKEIEIDPAAEELNDGFFDLGEMEDFADEEEDFHAFTGTEVENEDSNSKGDSDSDSDSDSDYDDHMNSTNNKTTRKYRDDEAIEALYSMYRDPDQNDDDDDNDNDDDDVIHMTAADYFGKPNKRYFNNWKKNQKHREDDVKTNTNDNKVSHSWDEYDFNKGTENKDDESGDWPTSHNAELKLVANQNENKEIDVRNEDNKSEPTSFSKQQQKLDAQTEFLENEMLAEKPWQMKGETKSTSRPVNSLLESTPEFTMASKIAPTITVEHTNNLEEMIKSRILAEDWDDVIPRELPDIFKNKNSSDMEDVSQEKSKLGLGEIYEREYLKKAVGYDVDKVEKQTAEDKAKNEMKMLFANLCSKLDALSNYHFAPRPVMEEADVREVTTPAIAIEEKIPMHVSNQRGVAPEEVYDGGKKRGKQSILKGESERDQADRKRLRNTKKAARRKARKEKLADEKLISRLQPAQSGLNNPYEKRKIREELSIARSRGKVITGEIDENQNFTTSTKFFKRMQEDTEREIKEFGGSLKKRKLDESEKQARSSEYKL